MLSTGRKGRTAAEAERWVPGLPVSWSGQPNRAQACQQGVRAALTQRRGTRRAGPAQRLDKPVENLNGSAGGF